MQLKKKRNNLFEDAIFKQLGSCVFGIRMLLLCTIGIFNELDTAHRQMPITTEYKIYICQVVKIANFLFILHAYTPFFNLCSCFGYKLIKLLHFKNYLRDFVLKGTLCPMNCMSIMNNKYHDINNSTPSLKCVMIYPI